MKVFIRKLKLLSPYLKAIVIQENTDNHYFKKLFNKLFIYRDVNFNVPKMELTWALPFLDKTSLDLRTRQRWTIDKNVPYCKLKVNLRSKCTLLFCFKDSLDKKIYCGILYHYIGNHWKVIYYGKTFTLQPLKPCGSPVLQKNALKTINSLQYLILHCNVIAW